MLCLCLPRSNAYMYGFFKNQRIVLFDTLIEQCQESQVTAVIAHELAHWKLGHNWKNFVVMQAVALGEFSLFSLVQNSPGLLASFGFLDERPALIKFMLFNYMLGPVDEVPFACSALAPSLDPYYASSQRLARQHVSRPVLSGCRCCACSPTRCPGGLSTRLTSSRCVSGRPRT